MRREFLAVVLAAVSAAAAVLAQGRGGQAPALEITQIRGDLYYVNGGANTVFLVTPDGIILADPVSTQQATWLKPELERRFSKAVRYVIYSHHDFDHAEGGAAFGPTPQVIAHENVAKNLDGRLHRLAGGNVDRNNNGKLDRDEASGGYVPNFDRLDRNHDGAIAPEELNQEIRKPDITYSGRRTLTLGGKTVELIHPGRNHSDDMTVLYFPAERAVFAVDFIFPGTTPPVWAEYDWTPLREWIASIKAVEALDFDIFIPGKRGAITEKHFLCTGGFAENRANFQHQNLPGFPVDPPQKPGTNYGNVPARLVLQYPRRLEEPSEKIFKLVRILDFRISPPQILSETAVPGFYPLVFGNKPVEFGWRKQILRVRQRQVQFPLIIQRHRLVGGVELDQLTLGKRVESPDALRLPVALGIALLKDTQGRIDLDLEVKGSVDDPEFSATGLV